MPRRKEVDAWFAKYENPMKEVAQKVREIVLAADARIDECIKWQAPTFTFEGNLASFFPKSKKHASLMFHQGAKIPGKHPLLEGSGAVSRMVKVASAKEAAAARAQLMAIVRAWCDWRAADAKADGKASNKKPKAKKATSKKRPSPKRATAPKAAKKRGRKKASASKATSKAASKKVAPKKPVKRKATPNKVAKKTKKAGRPANKR